MPKIDLHIHSREGSDGRWGLEAIFAEAARRGVLILSITDHDSLDAQAKAMNMAKSFGIKYITGLEMNVSFSYPPHKDGKSISLDILAYKFDINYPPLVEKLEVLRAYRRERAKRILEKVNHELAKEGRPILATSDLEAIMATAEGTLGRPHIAEYLIRRGIVSSRQEAFDRYLVTCDVPKMEVELSEAATLIREAGGQVVLAHPNDPNGTSLIKLTPSLPEQMRIISEAMRDYLDGIECWHSRHDEATTNAYVAFAQKEGLLVTGGSDCHQDPVMIGRVAVPDYVGEQITLDKKD